MPQLPIRTWLGRALRRLLGKGSRAPQPPAPLLAPQSELVDREVIYIQEGVLQATARLLVSYGRTEQYREHHEGIVYWTGVSSRDGWVVTTALAPRAKTTPGSFDTTAQANAQVVREVNKLGLQILGQVHGHPNDAVEHSRGDDIGAFMPYPGFLSLIAPYYGEHGMVPLAQCGVHQYIGGKFVRLTEQETEQKFVILPTSMDLRKDLEEHLYDGK